MTGNINPVGPSAPKPPEPPKPDQTEGERSFKDILAESLDRVNESQLAADKLVELYYAGDPGVKSEHVMVAMRKAQVAFEILMQIRNKLVDAYEQIQQMRI